MIFSHLSSDNLIIKKKVEGLATNILENCIMLKNKLCGRSHNCSVTGLGMKSVSHRSMENFIIL